jgi:hypothetical protein
MKSPVIQLPPNPFEGKDREQVWKEVRENAQPTAREEALRKMKELADRRKSK